MSREKPADSAPPYPLTIAAWSTAVSTVAPAFGQPGGSTATTAQALGIDTATARYRRIALLGEGGMGRVWLGHDAHLDRNVAIKEPRSDGPAAARLINEARLSARLEHPGVVAIHDVYIEDGRPHFVMALASGQTLAAAMAATPTEQRKSLLRHVLEVAEVIAHAHRLGILHRDLSPHNVLVATDGAARVVDWGLAVEASAAPAGFAGTAGFVAPEIQNGQPATKRSDVFSLGALLHVIVSGPGDNAPLDPELAAIVACACHTDPTRRYEDGAAFAADLRRWLDGRPVHARELGAAAQLWRLVRLYRGRVLLASAMVAAVTAALGFGLWQTSREATRAQAAEQEAVRVAAELLRIDAEQAFRDGDLQRARRSVVASLATAPTPETLGVWMQVGRVQAPVLAETRQLGRCTRWVLTRRGDVQVCSQDGRSVAAWRGDTQLWERAIEHEEVRVVVAADGQREVLVGTRKRRLEAFGLETGEQRWEDLRRGVFGTAMDEGLRKSLDAKQVFRDNDVVETFCEHGIAQVRQSDGVRWVVCHDGEVLQVRGEGVGAEVVSVRAGGGDAATVVAHAGGRMWLGSRTGLTFPADGSSPRLDLGAAVDALEPLADGVLLMVRSSSGRVRVLDGARGGWVASFADDTVDARPAESGLWVLRAGQVLERWLPGAQPVWRYQAHDGFAMAAWSADGARVAAGDGAGRVHMFEAAGGRVWAPVRVGTAVVRAVDFGPVDGALRALAVDGSGLWRVDTRGDALTATAEGADTTVRAGFGYFADGRSFLFDYIGNVAVAGATDSQVWKVDTRFIRRAASAPDLKQAVLLGVDGEAFAWDGGGAPVRLDWPATRLVALAEDGVAARVLESGQLEVVSAEGARLAAWTVGPDAATALAWRRGGAMVAVGYANGAIRVWRRNGALVAVARHHSGRIASLASSPDGKLLAAASWDAAVSVSSFDVLDASGAAPTNVTP